jgi:Tubulin binding cofactor C
MDPDEPPAVTYDAWVAVAAEHAHLDSSDEAGIIIEALETNAPHAFVRCNDLEKLAPGHQLEYRQLLIPVPELVAFIRLHAAATLAARFREHADAVWPAVGDLKQSTGAGSPLSSPNPTRKQHQLLLQQQDSHHKLQQQHNSFTLSHPNARTLLADPTPTLLTPPSRSPAISPPHAAVSSAHGVVNVSGLNLSAAGAPGSPHPPPGSPASNLDTVVRKKSQPHSPSSAMLNSSSAIIASVTHSLQRETHLVASNMTALLKCIAATYGVWSLDVSGPSNGPIGDRVGNFKDFIPGHHYSATHTDFSGDETLSDVDPQHFNNSSHARHSGSANSHSGSRLGSAGLASGLATSSSGAVLLGSGSSDTSGSRAPGGLLISRTLFEHLSFLLTTSRSDGDKRRSISWIIPEWRDPNCNEPIPLNRLVDVATAALTRMAADPLSGPIDTAEIRDLERKTIIRSLLPETNSDPTSFPHGREVRITNCSESYIYLLCSLGRVSLIACRECTLFVGSCVSVSLIGCDRVRVHAIARVCRLTNCFDTSIYLCTNRRPQIVGDCRRITLAPYNAAYPFVQRDLAAIGVNPNDNIWNQFYIPSLRTSGFMSSAPASSPNKGNHESGLSPVSLLPPQRFTPFAVPVAPCADEWDNTASDVLEREASILRVLFKFGLPLPKEYADAIEDRRQTVESLCRQIRQVEVDGKDAAMSDNLPISERHSGYKSPPAGTGIYGVSSNGQQRLRTMVQSVVQDRFREWLVASGNMRQIHDLVRLDSDGSCDGSGTRIP